MRQFVKAAFRQGGTLYTYHHDGDPVAAGDDVVVIARGGEPQTVTVAEVTDEQPPFQTKPIVGKARAPSHG